MKPSLKIIHWTPRILCILAILFVSMFALDSFSPGIPLWKQIVGFFMHMIPSFVLTIFLLVAWKWELIGGAIFIILGLGLMPFIYMMNYHMNHSVWMSLEVILLINAPFVVVGALFILSHFLKQKNRIP
jgi:hypothetical protein